MELACRLADDSFDLLILNHVYEHVGNPRELFSEAVRIVKPGGTIYVTAGSRWAVMEPHYRLLFLSWLPGRIADWYVRCMRRGKGYRGIRFLGIEPWSGACKFRESVFWTSRNMRFAEA